MAYIGRNPVFYRDLFSVYHYIVKVVFLWCA